MDEGIVLKTIIVSIPGIAGSIPVPSAICTSSQIGRDDSLRNYNLWVQVPPRVPYSYSPMAEAGDLKSFQC